MRWTLGFAVLFSFATIASAGPVRDHRGGGSSPPPSGGMVRDHRTGGGGGGMVARDHRGPAGPERREGPVRDHRGYEHVRVSNGRYVFPGGVVRTYRRPVIREHYYNVHVRPPLIVESYEPVPGYMWVHGGWTWGGGEWVWAPGYWSESAVVQAPAVQGGVSVSAGVSF